MIVEWITQVFTLLGVELPQSWYLFGVSININDLILVIFLILFIFFSFEIYLGIKRIFNKHCCI